MSACPAPYVPRSPDLPTSDQTLLAEDVRIAKAANLYEGEARKSLNAVVTILMNGYGDIFMALPFTMHARWILLCLYDIYMLLAMHLFACE